MNELAATALRAKEAQIDELQAKLKTRGYADNASEHDVQKVLDEIEQQRAFRHARQRKFQGKKVPRMSYTEIMGIINRYELSLPSYRYGRCYELTGKFLYAHHIILADEQFKIVHGYLYGGSTVFDHSWIEINGFVYDPVFRDFESINACKKARKRKAVYKYTPFEAHRFMQDSQHWGPWEELPERTMVRYDNQLFDCRTGALVANL